MIIIANEVQKRFIQSGLTIKQLAKQSGISLSTASRVLRVDRKVNNKIIAPLAYVLGCSPADIIRNENDRAD